ncbi:MAG: ATP-dependent zinc metalloprotease FtsH [Clostridia bacterium]|nr:ATP-dependent zinc metalloprotease FtsH [Clostridia bacterium]
MKKRSFISEILFYAVVLGLIIFVLSTLFSGGAEQVKEDYATIDSYFRHGQVVKVFITQEHELVLDVVIDGVGQQKIYQIADIDNFHAFFDEKIQAGIDAGQIVFYDVEPATEYPWWLSLLPWILILIALVVIYIIFFRQFNAKGGAGKFNSFGKARVKTPSANDKSRVLFRDVAGADEEKEELVEIVEFLKDPSKFTRLGAKIPHGVLLVGPPGTGKTLLAKAVAGEAGVPFYSISGSDFVEMYVGVGASRVRDLFETARKSTASIVFIDEIDAVGRHRGAGLGGGHDEREQTLNQLLVEMDGFGSHDGIIVIAATNRPDILDPALLRPGRFDRQVTVNYPDMKGREEILKVHARNKPLEESVDFRKIAQSTIGFTGADLANLLNEAALLAAKKNKTLIGMEDVEAAYMKTLLGPQKKSRIRSEKENKLTAYHEAGHAVVSYFCKHTDPIKLITIIPAGRAGGVTVSRPEEDIHYGTRGGMLDNICMTLGGRVAEELILDDISTGASGDIQQATETARKMVTRYGMSERLGTVLYGSGHSEVFLGRDYGTGKDYSEKTSAAIDEEIQRIIAEMYARAKEILSENTEKLRFVAEYLLTHESMDEDQFVAAMKDGATVEELEAIAAEKAEKSKQENELRQKEQEELAKKKEERDSEEDKNATDGEELSPSGQDSDGSVGH